MNPRIKNVLEKLEQLKLDGLLVNLPSNISYLSRLISRDAYLLISPKENIYFTDSRYTAEAKKYLRNEMQVEDINGSFFKVIPAAIKKLRLKNVGFEERHLPFAEYRKIRENSPKATHLTPTHGIIEEIRAIKDAGEIAKIRKATAITVKALEHIKKTLQPGKKEIEVVGELEHFIRHNGGWNSAFDIIVASGPNSAFAHHIPQDRKLKNNEPVMIDIGTDYSGYKSDLTRVFFLGRITLSAKKVYDIVKEAGERAIETIRPDVKIGEVDKAARQYITQKGYGGFFGHNLGHGIGLDIHEEPNISPKEEETLQPGMVFTVEPGIYLPGKFGIRIEDTVLIKQNGSEVLSGTLYK